MRRLIIGVKVKEYSRVRERSREKKGGQKEENEGGLKGDGTTTVFGKKREKPPLIKAKERRSAQETRKNWKEGKEGGLREGVEKTWLKRGKLKRV